MKTRLVSFADNSVAIDYDEVVGKSVVDFLFADTDTDNGTGLPLTRFTVSGGGETACLTLEHDQQSVYEGDSPGTLALLLMDKALYLLVDKNETGLALHSAAVNKDGKGILIPGVSGAGKSTMASWFAKNGYNYLTDELVNIPLDTSMIEGFTRPINIKSPGRRLLREEFGIHGEEADILQAGMVSMIPHRRFNAKHVRVCPQIEVILFPNIVEDEAQRVVPLSKAETTMKLVESLVNGRNLANHGFDQLARIAKDIPAYDLFYTGFEQLPSLLRKVLPGFR